MEHQLSKFLAGRPQIQPTQYLLCVPGVQRSSFSGVNKFCSFQNEKFLHLGVGIYIFRFKNDPLCFLKKDVSMVCSPCHLSSSENS